MDDEMEKDPMDLDEEGGLEDDDEIKPGMDDDDGEIRDDEVM